MLNMFHPSNCADARCRRLVSPVRALTALAAAAGLLALAACGSSGSSGSSPSSSTQSGSTARVSTASGCMLSTPPSGASATSITSWIDPRLCAWAKSFPLFAPPAATDNSLQQVQTAGKITVCAETDVRPIVYANASTGTVVGFEPDIMHQIAKMLGIKTVQYINIPFASYIPALQAHKCDVVMGGIAITSERAKAPGIMYTYPYVRFADVVIVKKTSPYKTLSDLRGKKFAVGAASVEAIEAQAMASKLGGGTSVAQYTSIDGPYLAVLNGTDDALVDLLATFKLHPNGDELRALPGLVTPPADPPSPYFPGSGAIITASNAGALNAAISIALATMIKNGSLKTILQKWNVYQNGVTSFIRPNG
jgi:ABC-type amino acid transport substrate-binding protein